ncbi:hypothetical protein GMMP13_160004 [Candidatus Magnetomoraceae bacterium gMMP-13]
MIEEIQNLHDTAFEKLKDNMQEIVSIKKEMLEEFLGRSPRHDDNSLEKNILDQFGKKIELLDNYGKEIFTFLQNDNLSEVKKKLNEWKNIKKDISYYVDLLQVGYYNKLSYLKSFDIMELSKKINQEKNDWYKRVTGKEEPWALDSKDLMKWRCWAKAQWTALMAEFCLNYLRQFISTSGYIDNKKDISNINIELRNTIENLILDAEDNYNEIKDEEKFCQLDPSKTNMLNQVQDWFIEFNKLLKSNELNNDKKRTTRIDSKIFIDQVTREQHIKKKQLFPTAGKEDINDMIEQLFQEFDKYCGETQMDFEESDIQKSKEILDTIENLIGQSIGNPLYGKYLKRKSRYMASRALTDLEQENINKEMLSTIENQFNESLQYNSEESKALWGLARIKVFDFPRHFQHEMLHVFGYYNKDDEDYDLTKIKLKNIPYDENFKTFQSDKITTKRFEEFLQAISNIKKELKAH